MKQLEDWKRKNGLDYNGWLMFIFKRKLRRLKLGFLIPFDFSSEWRNSSNVTLCIRRWGKRSEEKWVWPEYKDSGILDRLRWQGMTNKRQLYRVIKAESRKVV